MASAANERSRPATARRSETRHGVKTMSERERMMKLLAANPQTLAKVDAVLNGTDGKPGKANDDCCLVTYTEAAKRLNLSRPTVYRLAKAGRLEGDYVYPPSQRRSEGYILQLRQDTL